MKINRKIISVLLCLTLVLPLLTQAFVSRAANSTCYESYSNISQYREGDHTYPVKTGYVFAGWYNYNNNKYVALSEAEADVATNAYAKFVDEDVLSLKYQLRTNETTLSDYAQIRMITTVDTLAYSSVGFAITVGDQTVEKNTDTVFQTLIGYVDGSGAAYNPTIFSESSNYFMAFTMTDIPNSVFSTKFKIVPQWTTLDGTKVSGVAREFAMDEAMPNYATGIRFEKDTDAGLFRALGTENDATFSRVTYADAGISGHLDCGNYALKMSGNNMWPTLRINFGKELAAGTTISFWAYAIADNYKKDYTVFGYQGSYNNGDASNGFNLNKWQLVEITLKDAASKLDLYWNMGPTYEDDSSVQVSARMYIDNVRISGLLEPDIYEGIDFEYSEHETYVTTQQYNTFTIERVGYASAGIEQLGDGDSCVMKLSKSGFSWPTLQINFGKELPAGTKIVFNAYGKITSGGAYKNCKFEFNNDSGSGNAGNEFPLNTWSTVTIELTSAASYIQMFWNMECTGAGESATGELYIDNLIAVEPLVMDITQGTGFEKTGEEAYLTGLAGNGNTVVAERVSYDDVAGVTSPTDGGSYAMKISGSNMWPTLTLNFGKELAANTTISFWAYTIVENYTTDYTSFGYQGGNYHGQDASNGFNLNKWQYVEITLKEASSTLDLYWNMVLAYPSDSVAASGVMYIDNMIAKEPVETDIYKGINFEHSEHEAYVTTQEYNTFTIERLEYASAGIEQLSDGDSYVMKLSKSDFSYPTLQINFGKELPAGTNITFKAYGKITSGGASKNCKFEFNNSSGSGNAGNEFPLNEWSTVTIELTSAASYIQMFWNMECTGAGESATGELYIDNLIAVEPFVMDITQGTSFEKEAEEAYLTGMEGNGNTVVAERVSYEDVAGVTSLTDGGSYAMKISGSNMWPTLTFNFGKELAAGTTISFWAYTIVENYTTDYAVFGYQGGTYHGKDASNGFNLNKWQFVEVTLKEAASTLNVYWNMAPAYPNDSVPASGVMYIDNMIATEPIDICTGINFETEEQGTYITGLSGNGNTVVAERVSYSDLTDVAPPTDGGSYAMKLSGTNMWPTLTFHFGKELAAGTKISFWAYTIVENYTNDYGVFGYQGGTYHGQDASNGFNLNKWQLVEITLKEAASTLDVYWNMAPAYPSDSVPASGAMYIDNMVATEP